MVIFSATEEEDEATEGSAQGEETDDEDEEESSDDSSSEESRAEDELDRDDQKRELAEEQEGLGKVSDVTIWRASAPAYGSSNRPGMMENNADEFRNSLYKSVKHTWAEWHGWQVQYWGTTQWEGLSPLTFGQLSP